MHHDKLVQRPRWRATVALLATLVVLIILAPAAQAKHLVVDPAGGGDFTTLQAGIDSLARNNAPAIDSLWVLPGSYAETIDLRDPVRYNPTYLWCRGGVDSTHVQGLVPTSIHSSSTSVWRVTGLEVQGFVNDYGKVDWTQCRLDSGYYCYRSAIPAEPNLHACEMHGTVTLGGYSTHDPTRTFNDVTFVSATVTATTLLGGYVYFDRCRFIGSPGWAMRFSFNGEYPPCGFRDCSFENCANGLDLTSTSPEREQFVTRCRFANITGTGLHSGNSPSSGNATDACGTAVVVDSCHFDHCGTGIDLTVGCGVTMNRDTVVSATGTGIRLAVIGADVQYAIVQGAGGNGIDVVHVASNYCTQGLRVIHGLVDGAQGDGIVVRDLVLGALTTASGLPGEVTQCAASHCGGAGFRLVGAVLTATSDHASDCAGDGIAITQSPQAIQGGTWASQAFVSFDRCERSGGAGMRLTGANVSASVNVAFASTGDGIALTATPGANGASVPIALFQNTSVGNHGDGIRLSRTTAAAAPDLVQHNLVAFNTGAGMRTAAPSALVPATLAYNDVWANDAGAYAGLTAPPDSNLVAAPWFCGLDTGNLNLQSGSPCAPSGPFGLIGSLPVACASTGGVTPQSALLAFAPYPNPARGAVEFALPLLTGDGRVELLDVAGRVRWRTNVRAGQVRVRFDGNTTAGPLPAGLYWARLVAPRVEQGRRLVWLK